MKNRLFIYILFLAFIFSGCGSTVKVEVYNTESFDRHDELIEISISNILTKLPLSDSMTYCVIDEQNNVLPSQVTYDEKLIFQSDIKANQTRVYTISLGTPMKYSAKARGQVYPQRKEDLAWENDKVGFRFYNKLLQQDEGSSNGLDIWLKRTNGMVLDKWYRENSEGKSYHTDHGEGCDPYVVGHSLGAGAMAPYVDGQLILNGNYVSAEILDNGPLRFTAKLTYPTIDIRGKEYNETRTVLLDAGSQLTKIVQEYAINEPLTVAAGFSKRTSGDSIIANKGQNYFIYQEPLMPENGQVYLAVIIPQGIDSVLVDSYDYNHPLKKQKQHYKHVLSTTTYTPNKPITYYTGFGWNKFGFPDLQSFQSYMNQFSQSLKEPLIITIK